jgi:hypothetical protein
MIEELKTAVAANATVDFDSRYQIWAKSINKIDTKQSNGYMFIGDFTKGTVEIEIKNRLFLLSWGSGSAKYHTQKYQLMIMDAEGNLTVDQKTNDEEAGWALRLKTRAQEILSGFNGETSGINPLANIADSDLVAELTRRGFGVHLTSGAGLSYRD